MAGGTGGHIFPALAIAKALQYKGWQIVWLGAQHALETRLVPEQAPAIHLETLKVTGVRGKGRLKSILLPWIQGKALCKAICIIRRYRPDVVIGFGGFTSFAGGIAAKLLRRPLVVHEQNAVAGLTNKILAKMADKVLFAFPSAFPYQKGLVGNPVRSDLLDLPLPEVRFAARSGPLNILVFGGSLGAKILNDTVPKALAQIGMAHRPHITHQSGAKHITQLTAAYQTAGVSACCVAFIEDMATVLREADLVICRAGALTIAELAAVGVAAIMVPFAAAVDDHQTVNAQYLSEAGAGILIPQALFSAEKLTQYLTTLTRADLLIMAQKARALAKPDATQSVVRVLENLVKIA
jgi:UDP-N-acetylglucosamine--N-acetylmuramyl-(pentapeptide) pyrophosphoryl-undecaprenol N-acetylglucosamine transferase